MRSFLVACVVFLSALSGYSQISASDLQLLKNDTAGMSHGIDLKAGYVFKDRHWLVKYNPVSLVFGSALFVYQRVISPQIMQGCAFEPSCSNFSKQCIHEFGVMKGVALTTDRLTRCTRLSAIDFHPVLITPDNKSRDIPSFYRLRQ